MRRSGAVVRCHPSVATWWTIESMGNSWLSSGCWLEYLPKQHVYPMCMCPVRCQRCNGTGAGCALIRRTARYLEICILSSLLGMSRRAYPQYPPSGNPSGQPVPQPGQLVSQPNPGYTTVTHGYPGPPAGSTAGPLQGNQGYIGPPGGGFAPSSGQYPGVQSVTGQVNQMNLGRTG